jgi:hypothetical protein
METCPPLLHISLTSCYNSRTAERIFIKFDIVENFIPLGSILLRMYYKYSEVSNIDFTIFYLLQQEDHLMMARGAETCCETKK